MISEEGVDEISNKNFERLGSNITDFEFTPSIIMEIDEETNSGN